MKDELFDKFQEFKVEVENLIGKRIHIIRSENGGEYTSKEIVSFCKEVGIMREMIVHYNPQKNGVLKGRTSLLKNISGTCYMIKTFPCSYGEKPP